MLRHWIRYLIILLLSGILYVFYVGYTSWFLLRLLLLLPLCSLVLLLLGSICFHMHLSAVKECTIGEDMTCSLCAKTKSFIPLPSVKVLIQIKNCFSDETTTQEVAIALFQKQQTHAVPITAKHIGVLEITIRKIMLYDSLGLFRVRSKITDTKRILVLPKQQEVAEALTADVAMHEGETPDTVADGMEDSMEVRPYQSGDPLHRMHWKLSAKQGEWMVREYKDSKQTFSALYFEHVMNLEDAQHILTDVYSLSLRLLAEQVPHEIIQTMQQEVMQRRSICTQNDLLCFMEQICSQCYAAPVTETNGPILTDQGGFYVKKAGIVRLQGGNKHA